MSASPRAAATAETTALRFSRHSALRSEWLYGHGYQGPSSKEIFSLLSARLTWTPGMRVLDVGSGLGGDCYRLHATHRVRVVGLDASPDMTAICRERAADGPHDVTFVTGDVRTADLGQEVFDAVWTRDCGMYLRTEDKVTAWQRLYTALKPGGQVLITDYCRGARPTAPDFEEHLRECGHHSVTMDGYRTILETAGFTSIVTEDRSADLLWSMARELAEMKARRKEFLRNYTEDEYLALVDRWQKKIDFSRRGELVWMTLTARTPLADR